MSATFESRVAGIPCRIMVTFYQVTKPDYSTWASDRDYYGGSEFEYRILDRRGYHAAWLEAKATEADNERIEREYADLIANDNDDY